MPEPVVPAATSRKTYFVTGATGFLGGELVRQLLSGGHRVVALVRNPKTDASLDRPGARIARGDITDKASMREPMTGVDGVFHAAAWYRIGVRDAAPAGPVNVGGTRNVLELMLELGIPKGVYTSSLAVFSDTGGRLVDESHRHRGPWLTEYDRTKAAAHYEVALPMMERGLPLVVVLPGVIYGPGDESLTHEFWGRYLTGKLPMLPRKSAFCFSHIEDTARAHILAMERGTPGESYIIAGPPHTLVELAALAERLTGIPAPRATVPPGLLRVLAGVMRLIDRVVRVRGPLAPEQLRVMAGVTYLGDNARARRELGYAPRPVAEGMRDTLAWEMKRLGMAVPPGLRTPGLPA